MWTEGASDSGAHRCPLVAALRRTDWEQWGSRVERTELSRQLWAGAGWSLKTGVPQRGEADASPEGSSREPCVSHPGATGPPGHMQPHCLKECGGCHFASGSLGRESTSCAHWAVFVANTVTPGENFWRQLTCFQKLLITKELSPGAQALRGHLARFLPCKQDTYGR